MVSRLFLLVLLSLAALYTQADALIASVDRDQLAANESLNLTLSYEGAGAQAPDISALAQDFHILGQQQNQRMQINNGQVTREQQWLLSIQPKRTGQLSIPAFSANGQQSLPIQITVTDSSASSSNSQSNSSETLYGEADVDILTPYVQQQIILTRRLIAKLNIGDVHIAPPDFGDALFLDLGSSRFQRTGANGQNELVIEQRYALFPQRSGELLIPDHYFQAELLMGRGGFFGNSQTVNIPTPALRLQVKPAIAGQSSWLPARKLELLSSLNTQQIRVGEPFNRTITLRGQGLLAEQLPSLATELAGVKRYAEPLTRQNDHQNNTVFSQVISRETLIASAAGELTLPALSVTWYDTASSEWREAIAPAQTIQVAPAAGSPVQASSNAAAVNTASSADTTNTERAETTEIETAESADSGATSAAAPLTDTAETHWRNIALALGVVLLLWIVVSSLIIYRLRRQQTHSPNPATPAAKPQDWQAAAQRQDAKALYQLLMQAQRRAPSDTRQALLDELSAHLYQHSPANWPHWQRQLAAQDQPPPSKPHTPDLAGLYR